MPGSQVGQRYAATVRKMMDYGAFVELGGTGGTQALLHISELDSGRVSACPTCPGRHGVHTHRLQRTPAPTACSLAAYLICCRPIKVSATDCRADTI